MKKKKIEIDDNSQEALRASFDKVRTLVEKDRERAVQKLFKPITFKNDVDENNNFIDEEIGAKPFLVRLHKNQDNVNANALSKAHSKIKAKADPETSLGFFVVSIGKTTTQKATEKFETETKVPPELPNPDVPNFIKRRNKEPEITGRRPLKIVPAFITREAETKPRQPKELLTKSQSAKVFKNDINSINNLRNSGRKG